ncbi:hypothetical protein FRC12_019244 [Ceratobasidium sp. 428]|nr:hypothetical protein FRC12_019244 [Ceratobasidium sp. 428]
MSDLNERPDEFDSDGRSFLFYGPGGGDAAPPNGRNARTARYRARSGGRGGGRGGAVVHYGGRDQRLAQTLMDNENTRLQLELFRDMAVNPSLLGTLVLVRDATGSTGTLAWVEAAVPNPVTSLSSSIDLPWQADPVRKPLVHNARTTCRWD